MPPWAIPYMPCFLPCAHLEPDLLDTNMETIDPTTGCAHIAFADDNTINMLRVANQTTGCLPRP